MASFGAVKSAVVSLDDNLPMMAAACLIVGKH
jgi:hypothetical protein